MKIFIKIFLIVFVFFISFEIVKSQTGPICSKSINDYQTSCKLFKSSPQNVFGGKGKGFGGKINNIEDVESVGYTCDKQGVVVTIKLNSKSIKYFIPNGVKSLTKYDPKQGRQILGKYKNSPAFTCTKEKNDKKETKTIFLPEIFYFGTSKS